MAIPAFAVAEPAWTLRTQEQVRERLLTELDQDIRGIARSLVRGRMTTALSQSIAIFRTVTEEDHLQYDKLCRQLLRYARILDLNAAALKEASRVRTRFHLTRQDGFVLGSIFADLKNPSAAPIVEKKVLVSRDKKFGGLEIRNDLKKYAREVKADFKGAFQFLNAQARQVHSQSRSP